MTKKKWKREDITPEILRQLLHMDEETGKLYWKERGPEWFDNDQNNGQQIGFNSRLKGKILKANKNGQKKILGISYRYAALVYAIHNGKFGDNVTFLDGDKTNTKPDNLIDSLSLSNSRRNASPNRSGYAGVKSWFNGKFVANNDYNVFYETPIEAAKAYDKAAFEKWGTHARLNFPEDYGLTNADAGDIPDGYFD